MAEPIDYDKLMVDLVASLSPTAVKKSSAKESVSQDFSVGSVNKVSPRTVIKKEESSINELEQPSDVPNYLNEVKSVLNTLENNKSVLSSKIIELRKSGKLNEAQNLRYAFKTLKNAIEDLEDAIDLIEYLIS